MGWVTAEQLRLAVLADTNPRGEITPEQYKEITNIDFLLLKVRSLYNLMNIRFLMRHWIRNKTKI